MSFTLVCIQYSMTMAYACPPGKNSLVPKPISLHFPDLLNAIILRRVFVSGNARRGLRKAQESDSQLCINSQILIIVSVNCLASIGPRHPDPIYRGFGPEPNRGRKFTGAV